MCFISIVPFLRSFFYVTLYLFPVSLEKRLIDVTDQNYFENFFIYLSFIPLIANDKNLISDFNTLNPWYVTGLSDGAGSFSFSVS